MAESAPAELRHPSRRDMRALSLVAPGRPELVRRPRPVPGAGEVLLRVTAAGVCQTDLHICAATDSRTPNGTILGHEVAGTIEEVGPGVSDVVGAACVVHPCRSCGNCIACLAGRQNYCRQTGDRLRPPPTTGVDVDGGMAEFVSVPASTLMPIGDLDPAIACVLPDAGLTAYSAVRSCSALLVPGATALVIGVGGLGSLAARYLRTTSAARIIITDVSDRALAASANVADVALRSDDSNCAAEILDRSHGGVEVVLDFVGVDETMNLAASVVRRDGAIRVVGLNGGILPFAARSAGNPLPRGVTLSCPYSGSYGELREVIALAASGQVVPAVTRFPLDQALDAMAALKRGDIVGRAVLIP
jgi:propanol-preferring alcohol dehydrogenase